MTRVRWLLPGILAWLLLVLLCGWWASDRVYESVAAVLRTELPERIAAAGINRLGHENLNHYLMARLDRDLARLPSVGRLSLIAHCRAKVLHFQGLADGNPGNWQQVIALHWNTGGHSVSLDLGLDCQPRWPALLGIPLMLVAAAIALVRLVPAPLTPRRRQWVSLLTGQGLSPGRARRLSVPLDRFSDGQLQLVETLVQGGVPADHAIGRVAAPELARLEPERMPWLALGLEIHADIDGALAIARADPELVLDLATCTAICHGVAVKLPSTPFFYYCWYASLRAGAEDDGWFTNPPANRPDTVAAEALIALMEAHDGHGKAVADLRAKGLRARNLDQNRSKVKDELVRVLGESLAADYLFEMTRDPRTARYRYRLVLPPSRIRFSRDLAAGTG